MLTGQNSNHSSSSSTSTFRRKYFPVSIQYSSYFIMTKSNVLSGVADLSSGEPLRKSVVKDNIETGLCINFYSKHCKVFFDAQTQVIDVLLSIQEKYNESLKFL